MKITKEGQECRHCQTPVVKATHEQPPKYKQGGYWFEWWLRCPNCKALYMQDSARRWFDGAPLMQASKFAARVKNREIVERNIEAMFGRQVPGDDPNELPW